MSIYFPCEIRGDAASQLSPELYRRWGFTLGCFVGPAEKFVVGGDVRASTPELLAALVDGLCLAGVDCIDLGQLPTPMVYYARRRLRAAGAAIVTASHHPPTANGLQWTIGGRGPTPDEVAALRAAASCDPHSPPPAPSKEQEETEETESRAGPVSRSRNLESEIPNHKSQIRWPPPAPNRPRSAPRTLDISFDYVAWLQETFVEAIRAQQHIVLDPMHGCWSGRARRYVHAIFPECLVSVVRDSRHAGFGGHLPDCCASEELQELAEAVYRHRAHLGVALDGDGDAVSLVDSHGVPLGPEETAWILLRSLGRGLRGRPFVYDQAFSDRLPEAARQLGAEPLATAGNRPAILAQMRRSGAPFGAQCDGHYFFAELEGEDDALLAACRVIAYSVRSGKSLSQLRRRCPVACITPEIRLPAAPDLQQEVLQQVRLAWAEFPQHTLDGIRVDLPGGWALVRAGCPEPILSLRFEACDWPALDHLVRQFCDALPPVGGDLWVRYAQWAGRD